MITLHLTIIGLFFLMHGAFELPIGVHNTSNLSLPNQSLRHKLHIIQFGVNNYFLQMARWISKCHTLTMMTINYLWAFSMVLISIFGDMEIYFCLMWLRLQVWWNSCCKKWFTYTYRLIKLVVNILFYCCNQWT